jgi:hypothetical protein
MREGLGNTWMNERSSGSAGMNERGFKQSWINDRSSGSEGMNERGFRQCRYE